MDTCECYPAGVQVVKMGYFPCALVHPMLTFNINLLEFVTIVSHHMAPNVAGWSNALQYFLSICRYLVGEKVRAFLSWVLEGTEASFRRQYNGVSEMHCIGITFLLRWQTRKSIHGSGIRPPLWQCPQTIPTPQIAPVASKPAPLHQSLLEGHLPHSVSWIC